MQTAGRLAPTFTGTKPMVEARPDDEHGFAYRPALDGVRALAVMAVVGYHLGLPWLRGGFIGVDVFFVLSGFLITSLLLLEQRRTGRISLGPFWGRRARRLLPALLLVLVAVAAWDRATVATFELPQHRADLLWSLFYGSNWNLIGSAQDYFTQYQSASLVRHTWSLAIEEQFYLVWPVIMLGVLWAARGRARAVAAVCVGGIVASIILMWTLYSPTDPSRAYYGTEARAHQLLIGALLATLLIRLPRARGSRTAGQAAAIVGLALLVASFTLVGDSSVAYYGGLSAGVAVAAALVIWGLEAAPQGLAAKALGIRPARWIGKISYGVYLWHWPIIVAMTVPAALFAWMPGSSGLVTTRLVLTFVAAGLSYRLVERPIRRGSIPVIRDSSGRFALAIIAASLLAWMAISVMTAQPRELFYERGDVHLVRMGCELEICVRYRAPGTDPPVVALIGDSVARSLDLGVLELARSKGWTYVIAASDGCRVTPLLTYAHGDTSLYGPCLEATPSLWRDLLGTWHPEVVVLLDSVELSDFVSASGEIVSRDDPAHLATERRAMQSVADTFVARGTRLVFVEVPPVVTPPRCLREDTLDLAECAFPASGDPGVPAFNAMLGRVAAHHPGRAFVVSLTDELCPGGVCPPAPEGIFARYDGHHFTSVGARWIVPVLNTKMLDAGALPASMR
jgi:peptidoglycan/LPS O-acetylase OafA/YrhL